MSPETVRTKEAKKGRVLWTTMLMVVVPATFAILLALAGASAAQAASAPTLQFNCDYLGREAVDPIVDPPAGHAHSHDFYGNKSVNAKSTYKSLYEIEATTCEIAAGTTSYWHPAFREGGKVQTPTAITNYYRDMGEKSPNMQPFPEGAQIIVNSENGNVKYKCGESRELDEPPIGCTTEWRVMFQFPNCWNEEGEGPENFLYSPRNCPSSHPYEFPELQMAVKFPKPHDGRLDAPVEVSAGHGEWILATEFAHADRFDADQPEFNKQWLEPCVLDVGSNQSSPRFCENAEGQGRR